MRNYLIAYDIRDPRRWRRVYACLKDRGVHLQYSVFLARLNRKGLEAVIERLAQAIDPGCDDVRIYPVPENPDWVWIGEEPMPDAVYLMTGGRDFPPQTAALEAPGAVNAAGARKSANLPHKPLDEKGDSKRGLRTKT